MGGRSPLTGKPVGQRHRWGGGAWGVGRCEFCGHYLDDVLEKPVHKRSLEQAISAGNAEGEKTSWRPCYEPGRYGSVKGWYVKREAHGSVSTEWMYLPSGELVRCDTKEEAIGAIASYSGVTAKKMGRRPC